MRGRKFIFGFLTFSMSVLIILLGIFAYREYKNKQESINIQVSKETNIENNFVQTVDKEVQEQEVKIEAEEVCNELGDESIQVAGRIQINYDELIVNSANYSTNFVNAVIKQLSYIPSEILIDFENQGWKICIVNEEEIYDKLSKHEAQMYSKDEGNFIKGYTKIKDKVIYLTYHSMTIKDNTIIHEVGHYYDIENGYPSCTEEYRNIFEKEKDSLNCKTTDISTNNELFAETFEYVILEEVGYENLQTYQYVKTMIYHE